MIDHFDIAVGDRSPGWTPNWSSPEQVLGLPVTEMSDLYPMGVMVAHLIGAMLVGEVRKLKVKPIAGGQDEFDVFYDPQLVPARSEPGFDADAFRRWSRVARQCLTFDPDARTASADELADQLELLLVGHPLVGTIEVSVPGRLAATQMIDGSVSIAHVRNDMRPPVPAPPPPESTFQG